MDRNDNERERVATLKERTRREEDDARREEWLSYGNRQDPRQSEYGQGLQNNQESERLPRQRRKKSSQTSRNREYSD